MKISFYTAQEENEWDDFVMNRSVNGTFLQTRNFLNYHPVGRFEDCSIVIRNDKNYLIGAIPACAIYENQIKRFVSHAGSTFGGILVDSKRYCSQTISWLLPELEAFLRNNGFHQIFLKITPDLFSTAPGALLEYFLFQTGYEISCELSTYVVLEPGKDMYPILHRLKKRGVRICQQRGYRFEPLNTSAQLEEFYGLLCLNLSKFNATPVHTVEELWDLWKNRLTKEVSFWGSYAEGRLISGAMCFFFRQTNIIHVQYSAADITQNEASASPMAFLYYHLMNMAAEAGARCLSWGISTEDRGRYCNLSLLQSKEGYGSTYSMNRSFQKLL